MRVLILWADDASPNLGVRALGRGTAALVLSVWPQAEIVFQNYGHRAPELPFGRIRSLAKERVTGRLGMQRWLAGFDLVVDTRSGDSFADIYGLHRLAVMTAVAELAQQAGVPVVLGPQTIGPFGSLAGRTLARTSLRHATLTMARDSTSAEASKRLGHPVSLLTTDVVFALPVPEVDHTRDVVLNISGLLWADNPHVDAARYRDTVTRLYGRLLAEGRRVTLLAHVLASPAADNDATAIARFARETAPGAEVILPSGLDEVRTVVASASVVIGSRMHACLNALSVGTPAVPLAYSRKFDALLRDLGWRHTVDLRHPDDAVPAVLAAVAQPELHREASAVAARAHALLAPAASALESAVSALAAAR